MENIISQNFKNVLKNKIKNSISSILSKQVDFLVDNLFVSEQDYNKYFSFVSSTQETIRQIIRNIIISTFEEVDYNFKTIPNRVSRYYINKSNVPRTIVTIVGDISFFNWIKNWKTPDIIPELKLEPINSIKFYLCEFHFKKAIHHITSDKEKRKILLHIFEKSSKKDFILAVNKIIEDDINRADIITKNLNYIINNYGYIKSMLNLKIGSSMESHISNLIASFFSSRPKGFSTKRIRQYLKLNDYKNNNINIFKLYMQSYKNTEIITINQEQFDFSIFEKEDIHNIPILNTQKLSQTYQTMDSLAHPSFSSTSFY